MSIELYLVFVAATALLIATPGPNVALIVGTSLTHGMRTGLMAVAGVNVGVMIQLAVVAAGLGWIVELFSQNFDLIRFVGAAYLLFLGIQTLWRARKPSTPALTPATAISPVRAPWVRLVPTMRATFGPGVATSSAEARTKTR